MSGIVAQNLPGRASSEPADEPDHDRPAAQIDFVAEQSGVEAAGPPEAELVAPFDIERLVLCGDTHAKQRGLGGGATMSSEIGGERAVVPRVDERAGLAVAPREDADTATDKW